MIASTTAAGPSALRFLAGATIGFTLLTAVMTYPQVLHLRDGVNDVADPLLNTWTLAWIAHQLPFAPAHIFDGNIFVPNVRTLAYSETLLVPGLMGAPLLWLNAGPVLVYNLLLFSGFALSGVFTALLVRNLTGSPGAGIVAGAIFAFPSFRFDHYAHLQLQLTQWVPLALWALDRLSRDGRLRHGLMLGAAVACQALSSIYNGLFLVAYLAVVGPIVLMPDWKTGRARIAALAAGAALAAVLIAPVAIAHSRAREVVGERSREEARLLSAEWKNFAAPYEEHLLYASWSRFGAPERHLFPGLLPVALTLVALWPPLSRTRIAYLVGLLFAIDMSMGFNGWLYGFLYDHVFVLRGVRAPARMGLMMVFSLAVLAGFGVARLSAGLRSPARTVALAALCLGLVLFEQRVKTLQLAIIPEAPPGTYIDLLRDKGESPRTTIIRGQREPVRATIVEIPLARRDATYMYYSTFHWQLLVNGYSGFFPREYPEHVRVLNKLPSPQALRLLTDLRARYVIVHGEFLPPAEYRRIITALDAHAPEFALVTRRPWQGHEISLYRFVPQF